MRKVEIDSHSGFCGGVIRAISTVENLLEKSSGSRICSLGEIVHNEAELKRLQMQGLVTVGVNDIEKKSEGETLVIRAHGEPPETYSKAEANGFKIVDCTCPVVLDIQRKIREAHDKMNSLPEKGVIVIYGKIGHPEVMGLVGQADGDAVVVENLDQLRKISDMGMIHFDRPVEIFSQTTMSPTEYGVICRFLEGKIMDRSNLHVHDTICKQVASRHRELEDFAKSHDVILFVAGKSSSNGKVLCELCRNVNIRTYHIGDETEISHVWFHDDDSVGVCGATSTPKWLLERVALYVENLQ